MRAAKLARICAPGREERRGGGERASSGGLNLT